MKILFLYPNLYGMNMLPPAVGLLSAILKSHGHETALFDSTNWMIPGEEGFDSDKSKERNLNARPFDDAKIRAGLHNGDVFKAFRDCVQAFGPDLIAVSATAC